MILQIYVEEVKESAKAINKIKLINHDRDD